MQALINENNGLDGVVAGATVLSHVDGEAGTLILRGHFLEEIAGRIGFEGIAALLWDELDDSGADRDAVFGLLGQARVEAFALVPGLLQVTQGLTPIEALRAGLGMLPDEGKLPAHIRACGALPVFLPALLRRAEGKAPVAPDPSLGTAADLLRCLRGRRRRLAISRRSTPISRPSPITGSTPRPSPRAWPPRPRPA